VEIIYINLYTNMSNKYDYLKAINRLKKIQINIKYHIDVKKTNSTVNFLFKKNIFIKRDNDS
jgi:hypothetical protein